MTGPRPEPRSDENVMEEVRAETENKGIVISGWYKVNAPKATHAVSNMTRVRKAEEKGKRDRSRSPSPGPRSPRGDSKDAKRCVKRRNLERHLPVWKKRATFVLQPLERKVHEPVL